MIIIDLSNNLISQFIATLEIFITPSRGLFIGYLLISVLIAVIFLFYHCKNSQKTLHYVLKKHKLLGKSAIDDYKFFLFDKTIFGMLYLSILPLRDFIDVLTISAFGMIMPEAIPIQANLTIMLLLTLGAIIVFDGATFLEHYLSHKIPLLWQFHKIHHLPKHLNPITAYRAHPINECLFIFMVSLFTGFYNGIIHFFFGSEDIYILVAGQNAFLFIFLILGLNLQHSHIPLCYPKCLRNILVSPAYHQLHHSRASKHINKNFGFLFAFWDYFVGTQMLPSTNDNFKYGIKHERYNHYQGLYNIYTRPFKQVWHKLKRYCSTNKNSKSNGN